MKVLFASDGSKYSDHAARYMTKTLHTKAKALSVTLFYVDPPMLKRVNAALGVQRVAQIHRENADANLKGTRQLLRRAGVSFDEAHAIGNPAQSIARKAEKEGYDLVLMGSRGRSALQNVLLGSVTSRVLSNCKVPVLVVS
ncbi:MAG: universal stress protein [Xanthomonadales bacterium PRO7]|nr:universal stress protein [Xanthomonadales bacterium PRO7]